jgi:ankyrin repeat protein
LAPEVRAPQNPLSITNAYSDCGDADKDKPIRVFARSRPDPLSDKRSISDPHEGTGKWFLDLAEYQEWYNSTSTTLYIIGNPGVGKTVLAKFLVDELQKSENIKDRLIYFFCERHDKGHTSAVSILRSLIHQCMGLAHSLWEKHVQHTYETWGKTLCDSFGQLCAIFDAIMSDAEWKSGNWYCVLDGVDTLDYCDGNDKRSFLESISDILPMDQRMANSERRRLNLRLLVTSRPCESIRSKISSIGNAAVIHFTDDKGESRNKHDISRYIDHEVAKLIKRNGSVRDRENYVTRVLKTGHEGLFKWALCMVTALRTLADDDVDEILDQRLPDIDRMFEGIVCSIQPGCDPILEWVTLACRALSVRELSVALKLNSVIKDNYSFFSHSTYRADVEGTRIRLWSSSGLLRVREDKVVLLHQSVKDLLLTSKFDGRLPQLHAKLAKACIVYLSGKGLRQEPLEGRQKSKCRNEYAKLCENFPFLEYAATSWYKHVQEADRAGMDLTELWDLFRDRFAPKPVSEPIMELSFQINQFSNHHTFFNGQKCLHLLVHYNLVSFANKWLVTKDTDPNVVDEEGRTPLLWAVEQNNEPMVRLLLNTEGVDPNSKENRGLTPLSIAVVKAGLDVVKILIQHERVEQESQDCGGRTFLSLAAGVGRADVVQLLLEENTVCKSINTEDRISNQTPLLWAARKGHPSVVELLLKKGASPNLKDSEHGRTSLVWAAVNGHREVVMALLKEKNVNLLLRDGVEWSAFEWAAFRGNDTIAKEILDEARKRHNSWAKLSIDEFLNTAAKLNNEAALKLLLEQGDIDPSSLDQHGRTALSLAAERGHVTIVQQLLDHGKSDVNARSGVEGQTPLHWAAAFGREKVVELLLKRDDVDLNATDIRDSSACKLALKGGHREVAGLIQRRIAASPLSAAN